MVAVQYEFPLPPRLTRRRYSALGKTLTAEGSHAPLDMPQDPATWRAAPIERPGHLMRSGEALTDEPVE